MDKVLRAGTARVDITPPLTIPYLGYEPRHAFFRGVHDPLYARALAVDDGQTQVVLIAADSIGYSNDILGPGRSFTAEVRLRVQAQTGVPADPVMLAASHAHSTPETIHVRPLLDTAAAGPWLEVLIDQLASAASVAVRQQRPSTLKVATGEVHGLSWSRRIVGQDGRLYRRSSRPPDDQVADWGAVDHQVGVLLFEAMDDDTCILVTNFACHPVTVQVQDQVSADFPGAAMRIVEQTVPSCAGSMFLQGACGDQNPVGGDTRDFGDVERYGLMLAGEVIKVVGQLRAPDCPRSPPVVAVRSEVLSLPGRGVPAREPTQAIYDEANRALPQARTEEERARLKRQLRLAEEALIQIDRASKRISGEVQVIRLGGVALVGWPGEPFVELGLEIKRRAVAPHPFVIGYANDYLGYFATPAAWEKGGYEVGNGPWARVGPAAGSVMVEKALELIKELWDQ